MEVDPSTRRFRLFRGIEKPFYLPQYFYNGRLVRVEVHGQLLLRVCQLGGQLSVCAQYLPHANKGPNDEDAHLNGRSLRKTFAAMTAPCSVKAHGSLRTPP